jgi:hypothetical protein
MTTSDEPILRCDKCGAPSWQVLGDNESGLACGFCPGVLRRVREAAATPHPRPSKDRHEGGGERGE